MSNLPTSFRWIVCSAVFASLPFTGGLYACQVPVFRFALERWTPDRYQVSIVSQGPLSAEVSEQLRALEADANAPSNIEVQKVDVLANGDPMFHKLWTENRPADSSPLIVVHYPKRFGAASPVQIERLTEASLADLRESPARSEIMKRLTAGHSAVWVLLKSGDASKDAKALETLETQLARDAERLELPSSEELEVDESLLSKASVPLQIQFSVVQLDRQDISERFLIDCLLGSEEDLKEYASEPITFPVFGRGIVLYALVGAGISPEVIGAASKFIVGPCSCQVKEQNPGFDLLLSCDWDGIIGNTLISSPVPSTEGPPRLLTIPPGKTKK